ncbi:MAG: hypothetical protein M1833_003026 [Piccolia ochrophora]|nr:MAG: hypothetical protein M1833_003026 [Piccolia ochrophora]
MIELTVGYVSGIIALAVVLVQLTVPTAIVIILVALLREDNTAVSWSVAGRAIQSSHWPTLLSSDTAAFNGVRKRILVITHLSTAALLLIALAGIITPLGLYDAMVEGDTVRTPFHYVPDLSPMGYGTPPRSNLGFTRTCGWDLPKPCPGTNQVAVFNISDDGESGSVDYPYGYDHRIPAKSSELFSSGTTGDGNTISNHFDLQWRQYTFKQDKDTNNGSKYIVGTYRQLTSLVLDDTIEPVEGLIVDTQKGGIGFRNHTMPMGLVHGGTWSEDLLFVEPETQCVDMNITLDFVYNKTEGTGFENVELVDQGGFTNLVPEYPFYDRIDPQENPDLWGRAYKAAWMHNAYIMLYYNLTNPAPNSFSYLKSSIGKRIPLPSSTQGIYYNAFITSSTWGEFLNLKYEFEGSSPNTSYSSYTLNTNYTVGADAGKNFSAPNPWKISASNFSDIDLICSGAGGGDAANISNIVTGCGVAYGAARRTDGVSSLIMETGSKWTIPLYSCASSVRAVVKEVDFRMNGSDGLKNLEINRVEDKSYPDKASLPIWGVENTDMPLRDLRLLWGLISPEFERSENLTTVRKESLWLPGDTTLPGGSTLTATNDNVPAIEFSSNALSYAYAVETSPNPGVADYTGQSNLAMFTKWQELSRTASTTARIINLIWTDFAANMVTGTKSRFGSLPVEDLVERAPTDGRAGTGDTTSLPVRQYVRQIRYRLPFAIPAFVVLILAIAVFVCALLLSVTGRFNLSSLRRYLHESSAGRLMAVIVYPEEADLHAPTDVWARDVGRKPIDGNRLDSMRRRRATGAGTGHDSPISPEATSAEKPFLAVTENKVPAS